MKRRDEVHLLCKNVLEEAEGCPHTEKGGCPILQRHSETLVDYSTREQGDVLSGLSPRERQVHSLLVRGKTNKMIAGDLGISERTVEFHRANIMKKFHASSLAELIEKTLGGGKGGDAKS